MKSSGLASVAGSLLLKSVSAPMDAVARHVLSPKKAESSAVSAKKRSRATKLSRRTSIVASKSKRGIARGTIIKIVVVVLVVAAIAVSVGLFLRFRKKSGQVPDGSSQGKAGKGAGSKGDDLDDSSDEDSANETGGKKKPRSEVIPPGMRGYQGSYKYKFSRLLGDDPKQWGQKVEEMRSTLAEYKVKVKLVDTLQELLNQCDNGAVKETYSVANVEAIMDWAEKAQLMDAPEITVPPGLNANMEDVALARLRDIYEANEILGAKKCAKDMDINYNDAKRKLKYEIIAAGQKGIETAADNTKKIKDIVAGAQPKTVAEQQQMIGLLNIFKEAALKGSRDFAEMQGHVAHLDAKVIETAEVKQQAWRAVALTAANEETAKLIAAKMLVNKLYALEWQSGGKIRLPSCAALMTAFNDEPIVRQHATQLVADYAFAEGYNKLHTAMNLVGDPDDRWAVCSGAGNWYDDTKSLPMKIVSDPPSLEAYLSKLTIKDPIR